MTALVDATAGTMCLTTPAASRRLTPRMENRSARAVAAAVSQSRWSGWSASNGTPGPNGAARGYSTTCAYSTQCSGRRGVLASVHSGYVLGVSNMERVHSKHADRRGRITRAWPMRPSEPPSIHGMRPDRSTSPVSASTSTSDTSVALSHRRASIESRPATMRWNWAYHSGGRRVRSPTWGVMTTPGTRARM